MPVDEFRTIVRIHSEKTERQGLLHLLQGPFYGRLAAPQHGSGFRPGRMDVGHIQGMSEFSRARIARVGDQVHFGEPWRGHLPAIRLHRDVVLERSEEHTSELQSQSNLVCRLLLEKKKIT